MLRFIGIMIPPLRNVLLQLNEFKMLQSQFSASLADWDISKISSEDTAIPLLFRLSPESFHKYMVFCERRTQYRSKNNTLGLISHEVMKLAHKDEEQFFLKDDQDHNIAYCGFIKKEYDLRHICPFATSWHDTFLDLKSRNRWNGDFQQFVQSLHNDGVIFPKEIHDDLKQIKIILTYSRDSWASKFYTPWVKKDLWTVHEGISLFTGQHPDNYTQSASLKKHKSFIDLSQNQRSIKFYEHQDFGKFWIYGNPDTYQYENLEEKIKDAVDAKKLIGIYRDNVLRFKPQIIVEFLLKELEYIPPSILTDLLFPPQAKKAQPLSQRALIDAYLKWVEKNQADGTIPSWKQDQEAMTMALGKKPTDSKIKQIRGEYAPELWKKQGRRKSP